MNRTFKDFSNSKIGMLKIWKRVEGVVLTKFKRIAWSFSCDCGNSGIIDSGSLIRGKDHCGCQTFSRKSKAKTIHGMVGTPEYKSWQGILERCYNPKIRSYNRYGGRGISVCDEWKSSFERFYSYIGPKPSPKHSIDRIDNNGNYEPGNIRWANQTVQCRNRSTLRFITIDGVTNCASVWLEKFGISRTTFMRRLKKGMSEIEALTHVRFKR